MSSFGDEFDTSSKKPTPSATAEPAPEKMGTVVPVSESTEALPETEELAPVPTYAPDEPDISSSMKEKLRGELQAQGAFANKKSSNPILVISGVVALAVILGGQGFFF
jgi:hypothetical protein